MMIDGYDSRPQFERIRHGKTADSHDWLRQAMEQKSPRLTVELANSVPLTYDDLDKKLFLLTG